MRGGGRDERECRRWRLVLCFVVVVYCFFFSVLWLCRSRSRSPALDSGFTGADYATALAPQMSTIKAMADWLLEKKAENHPPLAAARARRSRT
jgi:hypothetical protein